MPTVDTWIDQDSGLPVLSRQTFDYHLDQADLQGLMDLAREQAEEDGGEFVAPEDFGVSLTGQPTLELASWKEGIAMAPLSSVLSPLTSFLGGFVFGAGAGMGVFPRGGFDDYEESMRAPDVAFAMDETNDRLTLVKADSGLTYGDFELMSSAPLRYARNGEPTSSSAEVGPWYQPMGDWAAPFLAGDYVDFCDPSGAGASATLQIRHVESNTLVYESTLAAIQACA